MASRRRRRRLAILALAFLGALLGAAGGFLLGRQTQLRSAGLRLDNYAADLVDHSKLYDAELRVVRKAFNPSPYPFCSPQEIALMQALAFQSLQLKDIGRTRDGKLYCSAFLGVSSQPTDLPPVSSVLPDGSRIYINSKLSFSPNARGTILEQDGVDVVVSPHTFALWDQLPMRSTVLMINPATHAPVPLGGSKLGVRPEWLDHSGLHETSGDLFAVRRAEERPIVVVTTETKHDIFAGAESILLEYVCLGAVAGFCFGLAIGMFYMQQRGLTQQFRRALRNQKLDVVYQPIFELPSRACAGAEALARWNDEDGNPISPEVFVRIAEERGLVGDLTSFVIRRAISDVGHILEKHPELTLSVNIAPSDLESEAFFELLDEHVREKGVRPQQLALEITERSTSDLEKLQQAILRLHMEGYQVHIDDFGTGFSSLAYLHELAVDAIKIDRSFTRTIGTEAVTVSILPQILTLAEMLHVEVIVEGVETEAQTRFLIDTGKVMQAQGWYFSKPVRAADLPKYREQRAAEYAAQNTESQTQTHSK